MGELTREQIDYGTADEDPEPPPMLPGWLVVGLLVLNGVLLGVFGLMFTPLYAGGIPVPMGAVLSCLVLPWLIARTAEVNPRPAVAAGPLLAWGLTIIVLVLIGPGGDRMLLPDWPSMLLAVALFAGLWTLRGVVDRWNQGGDDG